MLNVFIALFNALVSRPILPFPTVSCPESCSSLLLLVLWLLKALLLLFLLIGKCTWQLPVCGLIWLLCNIWWWETVAGAKFNVFWLAFWLGFWLAFVACKSPSWFMASFMLSSILLENFFSFLSLDFVFLCSRRSVLYFSLRDAFGERQIWSVLNEVRIILQR